MNDTAADFECSGCGHEVFGAEPVRCTRCNGMAFTRIKQPKIKGHAELLTALQGIKRAALDVRKAAKVMQRANVARKTYAIEAHTTQAISLLLAAGRKARVDSGDIEEGPKGV